MGLEGSYEWEMQVKPSGGNTHSRVEIFCADSVENNSKTEGIRKWSHILGKKTV